MREPGSPVEESLLLTSLVPGDTVGQLLTELAAQPSGQRVEELRHKLGRVAEAFAELHRRTGRRTRSGWRALRHGDAHVGNVVVGEDGVYLLDPKAVYATLDAAGGLTAASDPRDEISYFLQNLRTTAVALGVPHEVVGQLAAHFREVYQAHVRPPDAEAPGWQQPHVQRGLPPTTDAFATGGGPNPAWVPGSSEWAGSEPNRESRPLAWVIWQTLAAKDEVVAQHAELREVGRLLPGFTAALDAGDAEAAGQALDRIRGAIRQYNDSVDEAARLLDPMGPEWHGTYRLSVTRTGGQPFYSTESQVTLTALYRDLLAGYGVTGAELDARTAGYARFMSVVPADPGRHGAMLSAALGPVLSGAAITARELGRLFAGLNQGTMWLQVEGVQTAAAHLAAVAGQTAPEGTAAELELREQLAKAVAAVSAARIAEADAWRALARTRAENAAAEQRQQAAMRAEIAATRSTEPVDVPKVWWAGEQPAEGDRTAWHVWHALTAAEDFWLRVRQAAMTHPSVFADADAVGDFADQRLRDLHETLGPKLTSYLDSLGGDLSAAQVAAAARRLDELDLEMAAFSSTVAAAVHDVSDGDATQEARRLRDDLLKAMPDQPRPDRDTADGAVRLAGGRTWTPTPDNPRLLVNPTGGLLYSPLGTTYAGVVRPAATRDATGEPHFATDTQIYFATLRRQTLRAQGVAPDEVREQVLAFSEFLRAMPAAEGVLTMPLVSSVEFGAFLAAELVREQAPAEPPPDLRRVRALVTTYYGDRVVLAGNTPAAYYVARVLVELPLPTRQRISQLLDAGRGRLLLGAGVQYVDELGQESFAALTEEFRSAGVTRSVPGAGRFTEFDEQGDLVPGTDAVSTARALGRAVAALFTSVAAADALAVWDEVEAALKSLPLNQFDLPTGATWNEDGTVSYDGVVGWTELTAGAALLALAGRAEGQQLLARLVGEDRTPFPPEVDVTRDEVTVVATGGDATGVVLRAGRHGPPVVSVGGRDYAITGDGEPVTGVRVLDGGRTIELLDRDTEADPLPVTTIRLGDTGSGDPLVTVTGADGLRTVLHGDGVREVHTLAGLLVRLDPDGAAVPGGEADGVRMSVVDGALLAAAQDEAATATARGGRLSVRSKPNRAANGLPPAALRQQAGESHRRAARAAGHGPGRAADGVDGQPAERRQPAPAPGRLAAGAGGAGGDHRGAGGGPRPRRERARPGRRARRAGHRVAPARRDGRPGHGDTGADRRAGRHPRAGRDRRPPDGRLGGRGGGAAGGRGVRRRGRRGAGVADVALGGAGRR